jgi:hypothetical protein
MATTATIAQRELKRQAGLCLEGKDYVIFLVDNTTSISTETAVATWYAEVVSGDADYSDVTGTLATGSWNGTALRYDLPSITAAFAADAGGTGYTYDTVVIAFDGETYIHSVIVESPAITLAPGQSKSYIITFAQDD